MKKTGALGRIFPAKYDFYKMLADQASCNSGAAGALVAWLEGGTAPQADNVGTWVAKSNDSRMTLEKKLIEAFSTPFDRGDLYYISVTMHKCLEYIRSTLVSMQAFAVGPDDFIKGMAARLKTETALFAQAVDALKSDAAESERLIAPIRSAHAEAEQLYRDGMCAVFAGGDAMDALRHREIYHHLKDASKYLDSAVDILHRIIVRLM